MEYLLWFDDNPRKPAPVKVAEAAIAYRERFKVDPDTILVNQADFCELPGVQVAGYVRKNHFWVGREG